MNSTDKTFLVGVAAVGVMSYMFMKGKQKAGKPVRLFGLDPENSAKLVAGITILSAGVLAYNSFGKKLLKA